MKWTPDNDQILLLKILETCNVTVDAKAIAGAWPDGDEQPTARAVSERLVRLRAMFKAKGNGNGNMKVRFNNSTTPTGTPKKPKVSPNKNGKGGNGGVGGKRKRLPDDATDDSESEFTKSEDTVAGANDPDATFVPKSSNKKVKAEHPDQKPFQLYDPFAQTAAPIMNRVTTPDGEVYA